MKSKYQLMIDGSVADENGNYYPDLTTFPINSFDNKIRPIIHELNENEVYRFFDVAYNYYRNFDFYDDFILWINDIEYISDVTENYAKKILIYDPTDINTWYFENIRG
jgi:hypothetical protein